MTIINWIISLLKWAISAESAPLWTAITAILTGIAAFTIISARRQLQFDAWLKAQALFVEKEFTEARPILYRMEGRPMVDLPPKTGPI